METKLLMIVTVTNELNKYMKLPQDFYQTVIIFGNLIIANIVYVYNKKIIKLYIF